MEKMESRVTGNRSSGVGGTGTTINRVIRGGLMEKVMFKQRLKGELLIQ